MLFEDYRSNHLKRNSTRTQTKSKGIYNNHIKLVLGHKPALSITKQDIVLLMNQKADTPVTANHIKRLVSVMYNSQDLPNPASNIKLFKESADQTFMPETDIKKFAEALDIYPRQERAPFTQTKKNRIQTVDKVTQLPYMFGLTTH